MTVGELVRFNPIVANAFAQFESENDPEVSGYMQCLVAVAVKTGVEPEKIYATIKTGRMLTTENMKFSPKLNSKSGKMLVKSIEGWQSRTRRSG